MAVLTLWAGFGLSAQAQLPAVTAESAVKVMPRQPGVNITTPAPAQVAQCKVDPIPDPKNPKSSIGYVVRDAQGQPVRQFVSYDGKSFNILVYFVNGVEAYREIFPPGTSEPWQFRWLGANGSKWGLDRDHDGKIDEWVAISPEELSQELLQAILTRDANRAQVLTLSKANAESLGLPPAEAQKLLARAAGASKKVAETADSVKLSADARWGHLELAAPQTTPADALGGREDLVAYKNGTILIHDGANTKVVQLGEIVQVGRAWKLVDGPIGPGEASSQAGNAAPIPKEIEELVAKLNDLDKVDQSGFKAEDIAKHNARRVEILEHIVARLSPDKQETWVRLLIDALASASEGEKPGAKHIFRLSQFRDALAKGPNTGLAAYVAFRYLVAENNITMANLGSEPGGSFSIAQEKWRTGLENFAKTYPNSEEAPEAMLRLAMAFEYQKDGEAKAKEWYSTLARNYAKHPHAAKAQGAVKRLESVGKPFELVGLNLENGQPFDVKEMQGKPYLVYYCASWSSVLPEDARRLQELMKTYGPKGLELVTVCLDNDAKVAAQTVKTHSIPGRHLHLPGGLDASPLASSYGILVAPHMFVVGKDGNVVNRNAQTVSVEEDLKKMLQ
jgi:hypothetical protein